MGKAERKMDVKRNLATFIFPPFMVGTSQDKQNKIRI